MTGQDLYETIAWQANRMRVAEDMLQQVSVQAQGLARRVQELEAENAALKERLTPKAPPAESLS